MSFTEKAEIDLSLQSQAIAWQNIQVGYTLLEPMSSQGSFNAGVAFLF